MDYLELRDKYKEFIYDSFSYDVKDGSLIVDFHYKISPDLEFNPSIKFHNIPLDRFKELNRDLIDNLVFHLGLAELLSYWKATCSPIISIYAGFLNNDQISWWKELIDKGMGQYFFTNNIDFTSPEFITIRSLSNRKFSYSVSEITDGMIIPVGGGKDSAVTLELLKNYNNVSVLTINPSKAALDETSISGIKSKIIIERNIDQKLLDLNNKGFLNGHTPFSSVVAFISVFAGYIYGYKQIAVSNERSSDEENTTFNGQKINHQYSKTLEFENMFREYVSKYLSDLNYFSFLRPIYEIQIAKIFSKMPQYFGAFKSCNVGQKTNSWCCNCSKCLSTYILLKPFLSNEQILNIFKEDLINKQSLGETLSELIDDDKVKPFECVGTRQELKIVLNNDMKNSIFKSWQETNNLPEELSNILKNEL